MKKKLVTMGVSFLLCVGMVGAGFASWVISRDVEETADGTIKVEKVLDTRLEVEVKNKNPNGEGNADTSVYFGAPSNYGTLTNTYNWLQVNKEGETDYEDLSIDVYYIFNQENLEKLYNSNITTITLEFELTEPTSEAYTTAVTNNYIKMTDKDETSGKIIKTISYTISQDDDTDAMMLQEVGSESGPVKADTQYYFKMSFTYSWGSHFGGNEPKNPFVYYNQFKADDKLPAEEGMESDTTYADDAYTALTALAELNASNDTGTQFTITVTGTVA